MSTTDTDDNKRTAVSTYSHRGLRIIHRGLATLSMVLAAGVQPIAAQETNSTGAMGNVYCGTGVETGIDLLFGALVGIGLPAAVFYLALSGLSYMRAGGDFEKKDQAYNKLVMSGIGLLIIVLAVFAPEIITKVGSQVGFTFSDCVKPL